MNADERQQPEAQPHVRGASRGQDDPRDADDAGGSERTEASTEYAANAGDAPSDAEGSAEADPALGSVQDGSPQG